MQTSLDQLFVKNCMIILKNHRLCYIISKACARQRHVTHSVLDADAAVLQAHVNNEKWTPKHHLPNGKLQRETASVLLLFPLLQ